MYFKHNGMSSTPPPQKKVYLFVIICLKLPITVPHRQFGILYRYCAQHIVKPSPVHLQCQIILFTHLSPVYPLSRNSCNMRKDACPTLCCDDIITRSWSPSCHLQGMTHKAAAADTVLLVTHLQGLTRPMRNRPPSPSCCKAR